MIWGRVYPNCSRRVLVFEVKVGAGISSLAFLARSTVRRQLFGRKRPELAGPPSLVVYLDQGEAE